MPSFARQKRPEPKKPTGAQTNIIQLRRRKKRRLGSRDRPIKVDEFARDFGVPEGEIKHLFEGKGLRDTPRKKLRGI
ncbi:MAG: hypothetical protein Q7K42_00455 [Candidatus Diapherotrites archaeon]|nr:hypothetical protein [Candidatus Diapherotrites archaeon]